VTTDMTKERSGDPDKKKWSTPKLRVFVRTRAEEAILAACKDDFAPVGHPGTTYDHCRLASYTFCKGPCDYHEGS
jgi:hypothetical protein